MNLAYHSFFVDFHPPYEQCVLAENIPISSNTTYSFQANTIAATRTAAVRIGNGAAYNNAGTVDAAVHISHVA